MATVESSSSPQSAAHTCRHASPTPAPQGLAAHAWMGASASVRLLLVGGLAVFGALLVSWATAI